MNALEREQLTRFLQELSAAEPATKDPEADRLIHDACRDRADAAYLLTQRCLVMEQALREAYQENARLRAERQAARPTQANFGDANAWGNLPPQRPQAAPAPAPQTPPPSPANPNTAWGAGMLGNVAATAAGVVAGSLLFQGFERLMGHPTGREADSTHLTHDDSRAFFADQAENREDDFDSLADLVPSDVDLDSV